MRHDQPGSMRDRIGRCPSCGARYEAPTPETCCRCEVLSSKRVGLVLEWRARRMLAEDMPEGR